MLPSANWHALTKLVVASLPRQKQMWNPSSPSTRSNGRPTKMASTLVISRASLHGCSGQPIWLRLSAGSFKKKPTFNDVVGSCSKWSFLVYIHHAWVCMNKTIGCDLWATAVDLRIFRWPSIFMPNLLTSMTSVFYVGRVNLACF